jgi:hypothetical protein
MKIGTISPDGPRSVLLGDKLHQYLYLLFAHLFPENCSLRVCVQFCKWLQLNALQMSSFNTMFCGLMKSFTGEDVSNAHSSHFWAWNNPHAVCEVGYQVHFGFCIWAVIVRDIVGPYPLPDRLTAQ